jgi:hypothetical protein
MATQFSGNWACNGVRDLMQQGAPATEIARWLASQDKFLEAVQAGIDSDSPRPGGDGATHVITNLCNALTEV